MGLSGWLEGLGYPGMTAVREPQPCSQPRTGGQGQGSESEPTPMDEVIT